MSTCGSRWLRMIVVCAFAAPAALAAQLPVAGIKTGALTVRSGADRPVLNISAEALDIVTPFDDGAFEAEQCRPCLAGTAVSVGGRIVATGKGGHVYEADFTITGAPLEVPRNGYADLELSGPFNLHGRVTVAPRRESKPDEKEPAITLEGGGTITIKLASSLDPETGERLYFFQEATYQFSPTAK